MTKSAERLKRERECLPKDLVVRQRTIRILQVDTGKFIREVPFHGNALDAIERATELCTDPQHTWEF